MKDDRLISLNAAIDAIEFGITYAKAINKDTGDVKELFQDGNDELKKAVERVKHLPSAQTDVPDTNVGDMISRQAAIETVRKAQSIGQAHRMLLQLPSAQPGWIPVTERLPKPNEEDGNGFYKAYLVQDGRWMDVARWDGKYWVAWGYSTVLLNVVAWCELPKPYREGGQDG